MDGSEVVLTADGIVNPRIEGNVSGTLSLELWAFPESVASSEGRRLASAEIGSISGQYWLQAVERRVAFSEPPVGRHRMAMLLCEWTVADGYVPRDRRDLASIYERPAPEPVVTSPAPVTSNVTVSKAPVASKVKVGSKATIASKVTAAAAAPIAAVAKLAPQAPASTASGLVSIQTAGVDELAKVKGLNLKIAKEIIKARPFTSVADLIRVPGISEKNIEGLKRLLTLRPRPSESSRPLRMPAAEQRRSAVGRVLHVNRCRAGSLPGQKRSETPASSEPRAADAEAVSVTGAGAADSGLSNDGSATRADAIRLPAQAMKLMLAIRASRRPVCVKASNVAWSGGACS